MFDRSVLAEKYLSTNDIDFLVSTVEYSAVHLVYLVVDIKVASLSVSFFYQCLSLVS